MMLSKLLFVLATAVVYVPGCLAAEFLIMAKNNWMIDTDQTGWSAEQIIEANKQYRIGDIVQAFTDGKLNDFANASGKFYVIRVSGLSFIDAEKYHQQWNDINGEMLNRRIYRIRAEDLPANVKNQLKNTYVYNTTWTAVKSYIRNKITGLNE